MKFLSTQFLSIRQVLRFSLPAPGRTAGLTLTLVGIVPFDSLCWVLYFPVPISSLFSWFILFPHYSVFSWENTCGKYIFWNLGNVFTWLTNHAWLIVWLGIEFLVSDHCFSDVSRCLFHCLLAYSVIVEKYNIALISNLFVICFFSLEGFRSFFLSWMLWNSIMMCLSIGHFLFVGYMLQTGSLNLSFIESGLLLTSIGMKRWKREVHNIFQWVTIRNHNKVRGGTPLFFSFSGTLLLLVQWWLNVQRKHF